MMNEYYDEVPGEHPKKLPPLQEGEIRFDSWSVLKNSGKFYMEYISGELAGRGKVIEITEDDYKNVEARQLTDRDLLLKYGAF